jgi:peptide chain release factor 1
MPEAEAIQVTIDWNDLEIKTTRGSGAGGQHRNRTDSAVVITHLPTGLVVRCENERSQHQNKAEAIQMLQARLMEMAVSASVGARAADRKGQLGSGMRGDKRRTIAVQRDQVTDHVTGKSTTYQRYRKGHLEDLWG